MLQYTGLERAWRWSAWMMDDVIGLVRSSLSKCRLVLNFVCVVLKSWNSTRLQVQMIQDKYNGEMTFSYGSWTAWTISRHVNAQMKSMTNGRDFNKAIFHHLARGEFSNWPLPTCDLGNLLYCRYDSPQNPQWQSAIRLLQKSCMEMYNTKVY